MAKIPKERADVLLVKSGLAENRSQAQSMIMGGKILQNDKPVQKSGDMIAIDAILRIKGRREDALEHPWVGRGGVKLAGALQHWNIDVKGKLCADVGSSTGGFCDVLLQGGAKSVYAIDVGKGQLHEKLRQDERIISLEGNNARYITPEQLPILPQVISCDVSFISLQKALATILDMCKAGRQGTSLIALIKPQFQLERKYIGKGGIVKDHTYHQKACDEVQEWLTGEGWQIHGIIPSSIQGTTGNTEFFIYATVGTSG